MKRKYSSVSNRISRNRAADSEPCVKHGFIRTFFFSGRISIALILAGIAMMVYGGLRGEISIVFAKAVRICMECIGIG